MTKLVFILFLVVPFKAYAFDMFNNKSFHITIGDKPSSFTRHMNRKYGNEYGFLSSIVWYAGEEELLGSSDYKGMKRIYLTWEF